MKTINYPKQLQKWAARRQLIFKLKAIGVTNADIGRKLGITPQRVSAILKECKR